jgi:OHCU decarboxylase
MTARPACTTPGPDVPLGQPEERLGVLRPPRPGRQTGAAKRLTAESTAEQASAALDALTDDERATFQRLNDAYVAKHGFPFIIAVRDNTKATILQAFQTRIGNDTETEFATACAQVERIAELRLKDQCHDRHTLRYYAPPGGLPPQTALMTQRAVFTTPMPSSRGAFPTSSPASCPAGRRPASG